MRNRRTTKDGYLIVLILVFGSIFFMIVTAFMGFVINQKVIQRIKQNQERSLAIAEAGLDYYKWYLAHNPSDVTNGTTTPQPYVMQYSDPEDGPIGEYSLKITGNRSCGDLTSVDIESTGNTYADPSIKEILHARYAKPTVSEYAYIINSNVWAGNDRTIIGPYYANGGIHMDGTNNSTVNSGVSTWTCTGSYGCSPNQTKPGVFGNGPNSDLWQYPSAPINFAGLTLDLANMQTKADAVNRHFGPSGSYGYLMRFRGNNTFDLYRVTGTRSYSAYSTDRDWHTERNVITNTSFVGNYSVPNDCGLIFIEDKVWLEGQISGKVTLAAADVDTVGVDPSIVLNDNITYTNAGAGLLAIAENDVLVGLKVPNTMEIDGIFIAQKGHFGRNHYNNTLPSSLSGYRYRNLLTIQGTIVSNGSVGTKWVNGYGSWSSGFNIRKNSYDRKLVIDPPPLTPQVSDTYKFLQWRQGE